MDGDKNSVHMSPAFRETKQEEVYLTLEENKISANHCPTWEDIMSRWAEIDFVPDFVRCAGLLFVIIAFGLRRGSTRQFYAKAAGRFCIQGAGVVP